MRSAGGWPSLMTPASPGIGAILRVQRIRPHPELICEAQSLGEVAPEVFEAFLASVASADCKVVALEAVHDRLAGLSEGAGRILCLTFDGATRGLRDHAYPALRRLRLPFTVFVSPEAHDDGHLPWWYGLEALVMASDQFSLSVRGQTYRARCRTESEKEEALDRLIPLLMAHPEPVVRRAVAAQCAAGGIDLNALAASFWLSWEEIRLLAKDPNVSFGLMAPDCHAAGLASYDAIRDGVAAAKERLAEALSFEPQHIGFSAGWHGCIEPRILEIAERLGFKTACLAGGGALFAEEQAPFLALPRVLLTNDPDGLLNAQELCGVTLMAHERQRMAISA